MCILCVIQKWSRKVATMLPWLVIPLIGLWLLSQFLPPAFRFEITSPRLACVLVLLITLFWYEILMPQLSSWRARRNARLRERKRFEAIEMQKLRKTAIRRCRNCLTPYRDQNPSGGKFMCSYCGHVSKRPVLDLSVPPGLGRLSNSGILKDLMGKGEKMLNGKVWSDNNWICGQEWLENGGNWVNGSLSGKSNGGFFSNDHFFSEKSYSFLLVFVCKSLAAIFLGIMWVFKKLFRISLAEDNTSMDSDLRDLAKKGENGINNESRTEKARRKAEEKRQARLEREQLEEEERKQREEVARLVEERRKLRDERTVTVKDTNDKRETEKKRQERKKEKDRGSSKSNSDVDELEKRVGKEIEKSKNKKVAPANSYKNGSVGARYLDRMRGNFFPSSRTLSGGGFFGKGTNVNASNTREQRSFASLDHAQNTPNKKDFVQPERAHGKSNAHGDDQTHNRPAVFEPQPCPPPKRSWQQLFTRSSNTPLPASPNVISRPNGTQFGHPSSEGFSNSIPFGLPYPLPKVSYNNSNPILTEQPGIFQDPCYVPDPTSLIGPVSESLNNFQLDLGFEKYNAIIGLEKPRYVNHNLASPEVNRPSPIESPMSSRLWVSDENRAREKTNLPLEDHGTGNEKEWQMWNSSPLCLDTLDFMHPNTDDPWALRSSYGSMSTNNHHYQEEGSSLNHRNPVSLGGAWAKKEKSGAVSVEGVGRGTGGVGGLYSSSDVQSVWSYE